MELRCVWTEREGTLVFPVGVVGTENQELRCAVLVAGSAQDRQFIAGFIAQNVVGGTELVAQGIEQLGEPLPLQTHANIVAPLAAEPLPKLQVGSCESAEGLIPAGSVHLRRRRPQSRTAASAPWCPGCPSQRVPTGNGGCRTHSRSECRCRLFACRSNSAHSSGGMQHLEQVAAPEGGGELLERYLAVPVAARRAAPTALRASA